MLDINCSTNCNVENLTYFRRISWRYSLEFVCFKTRARSEPDELAMTEVNERKRKKSNRHERSDLNQENKF